MQIKDCVIFRVGAVLGALTVFLGSIGAHAIKFETEKFKALYDMGVFYQAIHVPVILFLAIVGMRKEATLLTAGVVAFCWALVIKGATGFDFGIMVPSGGMMMILAWLWIAFSAKTETFTAQN
ncbi:MAG: DUF423 domain-containing protein [Lentisphaeraceae bacterium]|nr:DUF423 domain-containing protein [Lentisphaeraceae bacterium]